MQDSYPPLGKRERNKLDKLERIIDAATELFGEHGVDHVTINQIAGRAQVGKGTLFLYARNKGELVLLVQNAHYAAAVERGEYKAAVEHQPLRAIEAFVREVVVCNRIRVENGRNYLPEILFGKVDDPHRRQALNIVTRADETIANILSAATANADGSVLQRAQVVTYVMFMTMALSENVDLSDEEIIEKILLKAGAVISNA